MYKLFLSVFLIYFTVPCRILLRDVADNNLTCFRYSAAPTGMIMCKVKKL